MYEPDFIVIRRSDGLSQDLVPARLDGRWLDLARFCPDMRLTQVHFGKLIATPTGSFELRVDGAVAEIWELH